MSKIELSINLKFVDANMGQSEVQEKIRRLIGQGLLELMPEFKVWAENHLIVPRQVQLIEHTDSSETSTFWLVTEHNGVDDSSYRIIYDENHDKFGFEVTLDDDRELFLGRIGSFADTVSNL